MAIAERGAYELPGHGGAARIEESERRSRAPCAVRCSTGPPSRVVFAVYDRSPDQANRRAFDARFGLRPA